MKKMSFTSTYWFFPIGTKQHLRFTRMEMRLGETSKHGGEENSPLLYTSVRKFSGGQLLHEQEVGVKR